MSELPIHRDAVVKTVRVEKIRLHKRSQETVYIANVVCGRRLEEALTLYKSIVLFTDNETRIHLHIFTDHLRINLTKELDRWPDIVGGRITYSVHSVEYRDVEDALKWKNMFAPCSTQRLFLPNILNETDAVIYIDTDVLFLRSPKLLWDTFKKFNETQLGAMARESEDLVKGNWYSKYSKIPYYGSLGLNAGVMLMNLTRMRYKHWEDNMLDVYNEYKANLTFADQDIMNIFFHFNPDIIYVLSCKWNLRTDHCDVPPIQCKDALNDGISLVHGNRRKFHKHFSNQPTFIWPYEAIRDTDLGNSRNKFVEELQRKFDSIRKIPGCARLGSIIVETLIISLIESINAR
ncbi:glucoside xylosyltransferase 2-like [Saccoglossus kowalevskii]|uniref:UDP-D-xylose:beta-D-glucoside alpha-1,3-D-xylosyltransferase n=1 Tax=Saccoglossus kowalevskii TaxID=10224 RepID=A0ABM0M164_SACKO|nr:PREDICTED: glucoside xylosyltransferase 2-like [Saccoglossus kowalevskii]